MENKVSDILNYIAFIGVILMPIFYIIKVWIGDNETLHKLIVSDWIVIISCFIIYSVVCYKKPEIK